MSYAARFRDLGLLAAAGWLACAVFLDINGTDPTAAPNNDVYDLVMHVAAHPSIDIDEVARGLRTIVTTNG